jgi:hypothetical protein
MKLLMACYLSFVLLGLLRSLGSTTPTTKESHVFPKKEQN